MSITKLVAGRRFGDVIPDGDNFRLRFLDGYELLCAWGSSGPEPIADAQGIITNEMNLHPQFQYVRGKTVKHVLWDAAKEKVVIAFKDGHELRSGFNRGHMVEGIDVKVKLPEPNSVNFNHSSPTVRL